MRKVVVYGGAFNPPTIAHQVIFQACVDFARGLGAEVWLLPSGNRTDKTIAASVEDRLKFLDAMISDVDRVGVHVVVRLNEMFRGIDVETYDSVVELGELFPDCELIWVFGADSTQTMVEWKNGQRLIENVRMLVVEREGSVINPEIRFWDLVRVPLMDVSSTELRRRMSAGEDFRDLTSPSVHALLSR